MSGIFAKGRVITLAAVHSFLDGIQGEMSIPVLEQHIRDLGDAKENMEGTLAENRGKLTRAKNSLASNETETQKKLSSAKSLKEAGNLKSAGVLAQEVIDLQKLHVTLEQAVTQADTNVSTYETMVSRITSKYKELGLTLEQARLKNSMAKDAEKAAGAIKGAGAAFDTSGVDGMMQKIDARNDRAQAKLQSALGTLSTPDDDVKKAEADALLASL